MGWRRYLLRADAQFAPRTAQYAAFNDNVADLACNKPCWQECQLFLQMPLRKFAALPRHCVGDDLCEPLTNRGYECQ